MIYIKDNTITEEDLKKLEVFKTHPFYLWGDENSQIRCVNIASDHQIPLKIQSYVSEDSKFKNIELAEIITYPTGVSKNFHFDTQRESTTGTSVTFLNDDFIGGEPIIEGVKITPITGRTYFIDGKMYKHAVLNVIKGSRHVLTIWYNNGKNNNN